MDVLRIRRMKIEISNRQTSHPLDLEKIQFFSQWVMQHVQQIDPDRSWSELSLVLTDDPGITELNQRFFNKDNPTDVISFGYEPLPGDQAGFGGEVIVNVERADRVGPDYDGPSTELAFYIAHGCHHLTGASDHTPELRAEMHAQEQDWLASAAKQHLTEHFFLPRPETPGT